MRFPYKSFVPIVRPRIRPLYRETVFQNGGRPNICKAGRRGFFSPRIFQLYGLGAAPCLTLHDAIQYYLHWWVLAVLGARARALRALRLFGSLVRKTGFSLYFNNSTAGGSVKLMFICIKPRRKRRRGRILLAQKALWMKRLLWKIQR